MFTVRLVVLLFLMFLGSVIDSPIMFFISVPLLYVLPSFEATLKNHPNIMSITIINLFLGWTFIGWVIALAWAYKVPEPSDWNIK